MKKSERAAQARRQLDRKLSAAHTTPLTVRPRGGWIRAVRTGLGMSQEALADRLGITPPSVTKLERSEVNETISIGKLDEVARALDCRLVYALVPNTSLEATVQAQAVRAAARTLGYVATTMDLEGQSVGRDEQSEQLAIQAQRLIDSNRLWRSG